MHGALHVAVMGVMVGELVSMVDCVTQVAVEYEILRHYRSLIKESPPSSIMVLG